MGAELLNMALQQEFQIEGPRAGMYVGFHSGIVCNTYFLDIAYNNVTTTVVRHLASL